MGAVEGDMRNLLVSERDQKFVLHEMLDIEELCATPLYAHLSRDTIDATLDAALRLAVTESYPIMAEADREGCRLVNGSALVPKCFHRLKERYVEGRWPSAYVPREHGGAGLPLSLFAATLEDFVHNLSFLWVWAAPFSGTNFTLQFGSAEQKARYLPNLVSGRWGSAIAFTEDQAGCDDIAKQATVAVKQPDGSYRIRGTKPTVTSGDSDLFENVVLCVLARVEGDPAHAGGLSLFLVPKYLVNADGSLGARNDYAVVSLEQKLGLHGSPTVSIQLGENGRCHAEMLGSQGQALGMFVSLLTECGFYGSISAGIASAAYLHALDHARTRVQGPHISQAADPAARSVAIVAHPIVRRRLLWMKSQVEGLRALTYYACLCIDRARASSAPADKAKWSGINGVLFPLYRHYAAEKALGIAEAAVKMRGRFGYYDGYPVHQFLRDILPIGWWEGDASGNLLFYLTQLIGQRDGEDFANLLAEMHRTIREFGDLDGLQGSAAELQRRVTLLGEVGQFVAECLQHGKALLPISQTMPLIHLMGDVCVAWLLFWQAGVATKALAGQRKRHGVDFRDAAEKAEFLGRNEEAAFYDGKVQGATFFIRNVLPQVDGAAAAIRSGDLSMMAIHDDGF